MRYSIAAAHWLLPPATWMLAAVARRLGLEAEQPEEKQEQMSLIETKGEAE